MEESRAWHKMLQRHKLHALPQPVCKVYIELRMHIRSGCAGGSKQDGVYHQSDIFTYPKQVTKFVYYYPGSEAMNALVVLPPSKIE